MAAEKVGFADRLDVTYRYVYYNNATVCSFGYKTTKPAQPVAK